MVELGCGTGQISLPLARRGARVLAVDVSPAMVRRLQAQGGRHGAGTLDGLAMPIEELALPPRSVDLVVSSYALHHLRDGTRPGWCPRPTAGCARAGGWSWPT